ncbi:MAG: ABC transporter ATP-binding protein [Anaerolineae bacterium]|nr:MAG: ABC transporter ATP-binding protein [Anaerolineae bacterium]
MTTPTTSAPLLAVRDLSIDFITPDRPPAHAVSRVSFTLQPGEAMGLVGESGCGKTTLSLALLRLLPPQGRIVNGSVQFNGRELLALAEPEMADIRWRHMAMIFQGAMNALNPVVTVGSQIGEAIHRHYPFMSPPEVAARVAELLDMVGILGARADQYPHQYSGGMRQRAMIAMALACSPEIVIADEPTTALDVMIQAQILDLLDNLRRHLGLAVIFVTHDLGVVAELCDKVLVMYGGVTAEYADVDTIYNSPRHPYTQELLKAFPDLSKPQAALNSIPGYPPRPDALPTGCRFHPRCPLVFDRCRTDQPALLSVSPVWSSQQSSGYAGTANSKRSGEVRPTHLASCHLVENDK